MKYVVLAVFLLTITGCSFIESDAGKARYRYTVTSPDGTKHEIDLENAKNIGLVSATVKYGDVEVELLEQGVDSSGPMATMAEANGKLADALIQKVAP